MGMNIDKPVLWCMRVVRFDISVRSHLKKYLMGSHGISDGKHS